MLRRIHEKTEDWRSLHFNCQFFSKANVSAHCGRGGDYRGDGGDTSPQHFGWPWPPEQGLCPWTPLGAPPPDLRPPPFRRNRRNCIVAFLSCSVQRNLSSIFCTFVIKQINIDNDDIKNGNNWSVGHCWLKASLRSWAVIIIFTPSGILHYFLICLLQAGRKKPT